MNRIVEIFKRLSDRNPHPTTELLYETGFELLVAVILSAQSTDVSVNKVTRVLFKVANTPQAILALGETRLRTYIQNIGLFNQKTRHIIETSQQLIDLYDGEIPSTREALMRLPGVGRKTANVILSTLFHQDAIAVDTHVFRVARRLGLADGDTPLSVEKALLTQIPCPYLKDAHHHLILHGRYVCRAKKPLCETCVLSDLCSWPRS